MPSTFNEDFDNLPKPQQIRFVAHLSAHLTVLARDTYVAGTDEVSDPARLRAFNEMQHLVCEHLCHLLDGRSSGQRYPDTTFAGMIRDHARDLGITGTLQRLLDAHLASGSSSPR